MVENRRTEVCPPVKRAKMNLGLRDLSGGLAYADLRVGIYSSFANCRVKAAR
jgi:hypothetical protein